MRVFEKEALDEIESLYLWADKRAQGGGEKRILTKEQSQHLITGFKNLAKRYIEIKEAAAYVENGREATIEDHTK